MSNPPIRTITLGLAEPHPLRASSITQAQTLLKLASSTYSDAGYGVQTVRLSTRPLFDDLADWSSSAILVYVRELQAMLDDAGLTFCSLGTAHAARPDFPLARLYLIPDLISSTSALNATVQLATLEHGLRTAALLPTAQLMQRLAHETPEGFGNFRFAALACVEPGCPFFPSAYHAGPTSLALGVQGASIVAEAVQRFQAEKADDLSSLSQYTKEALIEHALPIVEIGRTIEKERGVHFAGIDLSPAPMGVDSIAAAIECYGAGPLGSPGTLALCAALTTALKGTELPTCGYNGLMLPVLEDATLGQRWEEGHLHIHQLLAYSSVCGTGLDTIPLPGDIPADQIARLLLDVASLALRLRKPLSARLFPVPGKQAGERTSFSSQYLTNTLIKDISF